MGILVTGGAGFIGSHVVDNLRDRGHAVTILDRHIDGATRRRDDVSVFAGDIRDRTAVMDAVYHCDGVIHLAGVLGTQETIETPHVPAEVNVLGSLNVFAACKQYDRRGVYIAVGNHWMNNPYSITKTCAERFALMYNAEFDTRIAVVRGLNAYGPRQKAKPVRKVVPTFVRLALAGDPITVYGNGEQVMDMIYVTDLAEILVRALVQDHDCYDAPIEAGMGRDTTVNELARTIVEVAGSESDITHLPMRPGEEPGAVVKADTSTLAPLGYTPDDMTDLYEGMTRTVQWYARHS